MVPLAENRTVIGNVNGSVTLEFMINNAAPPVELPYLRWFYAPLDDTNDRTEITNLINRTLESILMFSDLVNNTFISLTVSNIIQLVPAGVQPETDEGRYFLMATNPAGSHIDFIDLLVNGEQ